MAIVRAAVEEDIHRILELYRDLSITTSQVELRKGPSPDDCRRVLAEIDAMPGHELLVVVYNGAVVGTIALLIVPNLSHGALPWALVENMVVEGRYRRKGFGRLLMDYAIARAREAGCYKLTLSSNKKHRQAPQFYQSLGFDKSAHGFRMYF